MQLLCSLGLIYFVTKWVFANGFILPPETKCSQIPFGDTTKPPPPSHCIYSALRGASPTIMTSKHLRIEQLISQKQQTVLRILAFQENWSSSIPGRWQGMHKSNYHWTICLILRKYFTTSWGTTQLPFSSPLSQLWQSGYMTAWWTPSGSWSKLNPIFKFLFLTWITSLICLIMQLSKREDKCQRGNGLPGLLTLPALFIHASETNGNILVKPNVLPKNSSWQKRLWPPALYCSLENRAFYTVGHTLLKSSVTCFTSSAKTCKTTVKTTAFTGNRLNVNFQLWQTNQIAS